MSAGAPGAAVRVRICGRSRPEDVRAAIGTLVDGQESGGLDGTGRTTAWNRVKSGRLPLVLAGGLTPDDVAEAFRNVRPWAVEVSSGFGKSPGMGDAAATRKLTAAAKHGEETQRGG